MSGSPEYRAWCRIKDRCFDPAGKDYPNYGGRGITVCAEWLASFEAFFSHVGSRPSPRHSIDRIDNDGHYEPGNVRWATKKQQERNKRTSRVVEYDGVRRTMKEWAELLDVKYETLIRRVEAYGVGEAFTLPPPSPTGYAGTRRGGDVPWASLTTADVVRIRRDRAAGVSCRHLAGELGVPVYVVRRAATRKTYQNVP